MSQPQLFASIQTFSSVEFVRKVSVPNANAVEYVYEKQTGSQWVLKRNMMGSNSLLAEGIGYCVSQHLNIPSPTPAMLETPHGLLWMTEYIKDVRHWSPDVAHLVTNLDDVGAMLTLDVIIGNNDRHSMNILLEAEGVDRLRAHSIDLEDSWVGTASDLYDGATGEPRDDLPRIQRPFVRLIPIDTLERSMLDAARLAAKLKASALRRDIEMMCEKLGDTESDQFLTGIHHRCQSAVDLASRRIEQIRQQA